MINTLTCQAAYEILRNNKAILIDIRDDQQFNNEHISFAVSIQNIHDIDALDLSEDTSIIFACNIGVSSQMVLNEFAKLETSHPLYNLEGGLKKWKSLNLPTITKVELASNKNDINSKKCEIKKSPISLFRQVQIIVGSLISIFTIAGMYCCPNLTYVALFMSVMLVISGLTGWCGLAKVLVKMPWNK